MVSDREQAAAPGAAPSDGDGTDDVAEPAVARAAAAAALIATAGSVDLRIPKTMRALLKVRPEAGAELREVPVPHPAPGELLIRLEAVSLCGTDLHIYRWD